MAGPGGGHPRFLDSELALGRRGHVALVGFLFCKRMLLAVRVTICRSRDNVCQGFYSGRVGVAGERCHWLTALRLSLSCHLLSPGNEKVTQVAPG